MRILILGSRGYLGSYLKNYLKKHKNLKILNDFYKNKRIDLNYLKNLRRLVLSKKPNLIINCSGITDIENCENNKKLSKRINVTLIKNIFLLKKKYNLNFQLIHFSTDQLYNNRNKMMNKENASPFLKNTYSRQKYESEKICKKNKGLVFRINLIGKSNSKKISFTDWIFSSFINKKIIYGFIDSIYSPISLSSISKIIYKLILKNISDKYGVYNLGSRGSITKYNLIIKFADILNHKFKKRLIKSNINSICKTTRSKNNHMNTNKFQKDFNIKLPKLKDEIILVSNEYK